MKKAGNKWLGLHFNEADEKSNGAASPPHSKPQAVKNGTDSKIKRRNFNFHNQLTPKTVSDLAVHPKKITEVETWLQTNIVNSRSKESKFLLITGPTGSGKTVTVKVLCQNSSIKITEWINPLDQDYDIFHGPNQITKFKEFLTESKWNSLFSSSGDKKIILIEEFPNALIRNPEDFKEILEDCFYKENNSIIFICTDSNDNKMNISEKLFTQDLKDTYKINQITFNPCATTLLKNALRRAHNLVQENLDLFKTPSSTTINAILSTSMGDIKSALNQYYFASLLGTSDLPTTTSKVKSIGAKRKRGDTSISVQIMSKDENLGLFHGIGRILNPKRIQNEKGWRLDCDLEKLIDEFSTQPGIFTSFLFENYLKYFGDLNDACQATEILSLGQIFLEKWVDRHEVLVFSLWVSVLGLMIHNEHRVSKWNQITGPKRISKKKVGENEDLESRNLSVMDLYYYNVIKNKNATPSFTVNM